MKITLDHNCLIHAANNTDIGKKVKNIVNIENIKCFVVNIGASEMREKGIVPDRYDLFEQFLHEIGFSDFERLNPLGIYDVTFYDHCVYAGERDQDLLLKIESVLFPERQDELNFSERKQINRLCDIHSMWCHISNDNDIFLTADKNFMKQTKYPKLLELGAKDIKHPNDINV